MDNIIQFPAKNSEIFPSSAEESMEILNSVRKEFCDEVVADTLEAVTSVFSSYGFTPASDVQTIKDIVFIEEALKAFTYRYKNLGHPLHPIIEQTISVSDEIQKQLEKNESTLQTSEE